MLRVSTTHIPQQEAGRLLSEWLLESAHTPVLLLCSGGSALSFLSYVTLPEEPKLTVGVIDERFTDAPTGNNFLQLSATEFFQRAVRAGAVAISSVPEVGEDLPSFSDRFEGALRAWRMQNPEGLVIATLGIGGDGHTAGILPFPELPEVFDKLFIETEAYAVGYSAVVETTYRERVTVTAKFLLQEVSKSLVFAVGPEKKIILEQLPLNLPAHIYPMAILKKARNTVLVTDVAVAF